MKNGSIVSKICLYLSVLAISLSMFSCAHTQKPAEKPLTLKTFEGHYEDIFETALRVVQNDKKIPITLANINNGFVISDWVKEDRTIHDKNLSLTRRAETRYRINLSFRHIPAAGKDKGVERVLVTANKQMETREGNTWRSFPTDFQLEGDIIASIGRALNQE